GKPSVELPRDGKLRLAAGERRLELLAQRATRPEDDGLDGARRELQDLGDLGVGTPLELAHDERGPLVERELSERAPDVLGARRFLLVRADEPVADVVVEGDLDGTPRRLPEALAADVVGDRDQPVLR